MAYSSYYNGKKYTQSYDPNVDYSALINEAVKNGDLASAGKYEQQRNEKIDALGLGYEKTNDYSQYYQKPEGYDPDTDYSALIADAAANKDYDAAAMYEQQRNDKIIGENLKYDQTSKYTAYGEAKDQEKSAYDRYMNRDKFSYNVEDDPLYQQYKDMFMSQGKIAMQDTMGQVAALTGGYGNSYAQTVGQQMYNQYLGKMNNIVPELYKAAYSRYQDEGNDLLKQYQMAAGRADTELSKIEARASDAYNNALTLIKSGIMPDKNMLNEAGIPWEMALNYWKIANGTDYVAPVAGGNGNATGSYSGYVGTYTGSKPSASENSLMDLAAQYAAAHPGGQVDSVSVDTWLNNQGLTYEDKNKVKNYLVQEGFDYRYKP